MSLLEEYGGVVCSIIAWDIVSLGVRYVIAFSIALLAASDISVSMMSSLAVAERRPIRFARCMR